MKKKHGLSQYRLNYAKGYAQGFIETVTRIEMMFQMSADGLVDDEMAENFIVNNIKELEMNWESFKSYIQQRDDMR